MPERTRRLRAPRTVRPVPVPGCDAKWAWHPTKGVDRTAYRIEWQDGTPTGTGLFVGAEWAQKYAEGRGWEIDIDQSEEECA